MKLVVTARQASCRICACERTGRTAFQIIRLVRTARGMWCRRAVPGHRLQADELLRDRFRKYAEGSSPLATPPLSGFDARIRAQRGTLWEFGPYNIAD